MTGTADLAFNPAAGAYDPTASGSQISSAWSLPPDLLQSIQSAVGGMNTALQAQGQIPGLLGSVQQGQQQLQQSQALDTSTYPTYPNPAGLGTQTGSQAPVQAVSAAQYIADRGQTPWSYIGEALSRQR